jgi:hypothetical protein
LLPLWPRASGSPRSRQAGWALARAGIGHRGRLRAGVALIPRGEFSIIYRRSHHHRGKRWTYHSRPPLRTPGRWLRAAAGSDCLDHRLPAFFNTASHHRPHPTVTSASVGGPEKGTRTPPHGEMAQCSTAHAHPDSKFSNCRQRVKIRLARRLRSTTGSTTMSPGAWTMVAVRRIPTDDQQVQGASL